VGVIVLERAVLWFELGGEERLIVLGEYYRATGTGTVTELKPPSTKTSASACTD
jgi:hypothetical protein